jgi:hypothetical protein
MLNYIVQHAVDNVWCAPEQDYQSIIKPARLTDARGAVGHQQIMWERVPLPTNSDRYHVFQIGHIHPKLLGMLTEIINDTDLVAELYFMDGRLLPRAQCFFKYSRNHNLILAVRDMPTRFHDLRSTPFYLRVYSNAYFKSTRRTAEDKTAIYSTRRVNLQSVLDAQQILNTYKALPGKTFTYINGKLSDDLRPSWIVDGDYMEIFYDSSVYKTVDLDVRDLATFDSELDFKRKYLLTYPSSDPTVDFEDDIDIYLIRKTPQGWYQGIHYNRNHADSIRMLTHKDYSIPVPYVLGFQQSNSDVWSDVNDLTVRLYIRKAGLVHSLINEHSRISELYKMSHEDIKRAMLGIDSTVDVWNAVNLEKGSYVKLMRDSSRALDSASVQDAYGYNAVSKLAGDTPQRTQDRGTYREVILPIGLAYDCTVYEYDTQGKLIDFHYHASGTTYICNSINCSYVEVVAGRGSRSLDVVYDQYSTPINKDYNYRVYICTRLALGPKWDWVDVSNSELIDVHNGVLTVAADPFGDYPAILSDKRFIAYSLNLSPTAGVYQFSISTEQTHYDQTSIMLEHIPPRRLDIWINGHPAIQGLDYFVKWPQIVITNKEFLVPGDVQSIVVRGQGFCNDDMSMEKYREFGFVQNGYLSSNWRYDIRDDKVLSYVVDGRLRMVDTLKFAENNTGVSVPNARNGAPYTVKETIVPLRSQFYQDTYKMRDLSIEIDNQISDYLTLKFPQPDLPAISPITQRYAVYSPFLARITHALSNGEIPASEIEKHYNDQQIHKWIEPFKYLLDFDPAWNEVDDGYVVVHPHRYASVVSLNIYHHNFLRRVVSLFLSNRVQTAQFYEITLPTE